MQIVSCQIAFIAVSIVLHIHHRLHPPHHPSVILQTHLIYRAHPFQTMAYPCHQNDFFPLSANFAFALTILFHLTSVSSHALYEIHHLLDHSSFSSHLLHFDLCLEALLIFLAPAATN